MVGQNISHYKILEKLGQGGMGVVYRAEDLRLDRHVAIKMLPAEMGSDEEQKARFIQEAKAASAIDHPNIGGIHEIDETEDGDLFIVMAYYEGETLKQKIARGSIPDEEAIDIGIQIARGMARAHATGIIHRDLKPGNIIITTDGTAKIIDFGLAKFSAGLRLTRTATSLGTVAYMAPEQLRAEEVGPQADIWSLGVILYEMVTGKFPFRGEFETALMYSIANELPVPISSFRDDVPEGLQVTMLRCLEKDPAARCQSMAEVERFLRETREGKVPQPGAAASGVATAEHRVHRREEPLHKKTGFQRILRNRRLPWIGGAVIVLIAAMLTVYLTTRQRMPGSSSLEKSIVILPFRNIAGADYEYLADGIASDLTDRLASHPDLLVISHRSAERFRNSSLPDSAIAAAFGIRFLVSGDLNVLPAYFTLRLRVFNAEEGKIIWEGDFQQSRSEILSLTLAILGRLLEQVDAAVTGVPPPRTTSVVYDTHLHGLFYRERLTRDDNALALAYFTEAVKLDSSFIPAQVSLANTHIEQYLSGWDPSPEHLGHAEAACHVVLRHDSIHATTLAMLGKILDLRGDREEGLRLLRKAIDEEPNNAYALATLGELYIFETNEPLKGIVTLKRFREVDPKDWLSTTYLGIAYAQNKNYPEASAAFREAAELNPAHAWPPYNLAYVFERLGSLDSAEIFYRKALERDRRFAKTYSSLASILMSQGKYFDADTLLGSGLRYLPDDVELIYLAGLNLRFRGKIPESLRRFRDGERIVQDELKSQRDATGYLAYEALFAVRLGDSNRAIRLAGQIAALDSTHEETVLMIARIYAVIGDKPRVLHWFSRARQMNPEYDGAFLRTAPDFESYRNDPDLLSAAR